MRNFLLVLVFFAASHVLHAQSWQLMGIKGMHAGYGGQIHKKLYFDRNHELHLAFVPVFTKKITDLKWSGTSWEVFFELSLNNEVGYIDVEIDSKGKYYLGYVYQVANDMFAKVRVFDPLSGWSLLGDSLPNVNHGMDIAIDPKDSVYANLGKKIVKYGPAGKAKDITPTAYGELYHTASDKGMYFDAKGTVHLFINYKIGPPQSYEYEGRIVKYEDGQWKQVGSTTNALNYQYISVNKDKSVLLAGHEMLFGSKLYVQKLSTNLWGNLATLKPSGNPSFAANTAGDLYFSGMVRGGTVLEQMGASTYILDTLSVEGSYLSVTNVAVDTTTNELYVAVDNTINFALFPSVYKYAGGKTLLGMQHATSSMEKLILYPNPVQGGKVSISGIESTDKVEVYNQWGFLVRKVEGNTKDVSVEGLAKGVYTVIAYKDGAKTCQKLLVE